MTDIINEEENSNQIPEEIEDIAVVDNGTTYESTETAIIAKAEADKAKLWAQESERQANLASGSADTAAQARDDAVAAKEYAEAAADDANVVAVGTDLRSTPSNIVTVAGMKSDIDDVVDVKEGVEWIANNKQTVTDVVDNEANINAVAANEANINAVNANKTNIDNVAANEANINAVNANKTNIDINATNINAINTNATNITDIQNASGNAARAKNWAIKMDGLVDGEDYSAKYYADKARQAASGAVTDGKSITRNSDDELQTIGVINQNDTTTAVKTWTGTKAQYDAIISKDPNTLYEVEGYGVFLGTTQIAAGSAELNNPSSLFDFQFADHILNNASWLRADTFSWQSGEVYVSAYEHLVDDIDGITAETETIGSNTITFYRATDGHKICLADQENIVAAIYSDKGVAWYYILDTANTRFKLPRTKFGVTGLRGAVGDYVEAGLPNITGEVSFTSGAVSGKWYYHYPRIASGAFSQGDNSENVSNDGVSSHTTASGSVLFNASNSSSIYGNSTTVQPRATEMYLYFYVGETIQDATLIDVGEITDTLNGKADVDGSNMATSVKNFDGQWVASSAILADTVTAPTSTGLDYSLSSYLPNDGYNYEVLFDIEGVTASSSGSYTVGYLKTDISNDCWVCEGRAQSNSGTRAAGNAILPVGTGRSVTIRNASRNTGTITLYARGYRRIGTNS